MHSNDTWAGELPPDNTLNRLVDSHGAWATLAALLRVLATRRRPRRAAEPFGDHLRRDLGLPELSPAPPRLRDPWL